MALPVNGSTHLIPAYYSIYRPRKDERLSWPSWLTCIGWLTHISGHPSAAGRAQDRESSPARDRRSTTLPRHQPVEVSTSLKFPRIPWDSHENGNDISGMGRNRNATAPEYSRLRSRRSVMKRDAQRHKVVFIITKQHQRLAILHDISNYQLLQTWHNVTYYAV